MKRRLPKTPAQWLAEIRLAYEDAREAQLLDDFDDSDLFHLAPLVCLKFRGLDYRDKKLRKRVTEGALATYVANSDREGVKEALKASPQMTFALCYLTAHFVLDLVDEKQADEVLVYCEQHFDEA